MPKTATVTEIEKMFYAVGFGSVPCWLKPYGVLSNGEQMRVRLAKALLSSDKVLFDEFTSVVDRNVAKTLCMALNKCLKRYAQKKFVAVSCHKDIVEYLQPDWIFDTDTMQMSFLKARDHQNGMKYTALDVRRGQNLGTIII
jgi:ABC-type ATPase with predicted acetyltransferase domain